MTGSCHQSVTRQGQPTSLLAWPNIRRQKYLAKNPRGPTEPFSDGPPVALWYQHADRWERNIFFSSRPTTW